MENREIVYDKAVIDYFKYLVDVLFENSYFASRESSKKYVDDIINHIEEYLHLMQEYQTPSNFNSYGKYFSKAIIKGRTTWYVFFDREDSLYYIKFITNTHVAEGSFLTGLNETIGD